jgi:hypothetical protein
MTRNKKTKSIKTNKNIEPINNFNSLKKPLNDKGDPNY